MSIREDYIQRRISGPRQNVSKVPGSREGHLEEPSGLHVGRLVVSPPKGPMFVFHKKHGIVLAPLELMHRHDADVGCFPVIVDDLVLEYRLRPTQPRHPRSCPVASRVPPAASSIADPRRRRRRYRAMVPRAFEFVCVAAGERSKNRTPVLCRGSDETNRPDRLERGCQGP